MSRIRHLLGTGDLSAQEIARLLDRAIEIKAGPERYAAALAGKTLLMIFAKPSLRTRLSFEVAMTQLGGHAIYYDLAASPLGKGKETVADTARAASRYVSVVMARLFAHAQIEELARHATVPVINGLTDFEHPCQALADLMTIREKRGALAGLKLAYFGDAHNNVAHSLLLACPKLAMEVAVAAPPGDEYRPRRDVVEAARAAGGRVMLTHDPAEAARGADVVVTDSWMSYHVPREQEAQRIRALSPYQVNARLMAMAHPQVIFEHCLPATRGQEVTAEVIDGPQSVVWDEAENRLHAQKAALLWLLGR